MRLAVGAVLLLLGVCLLGAVCLYFRYKPRRAIEDMTLATIFDVVWNDGVWTILIPVMLIVAGVMVIITELMA